ncbi:hypothetical protein [Mesorhizobium sp. B1-1-1]|uniref:hypothetical protein n=1 Tax=Mesorhizobium sp. B1-1-1 TaxID=2589983 RepID=UPI0015E35181|nr:hypothetical protein [Mesorhizobium sp. B1-1-1]
MHPPLRCSRCRQQESEIHVDAAIPFGCAHFIEILQEEENGFDALALTAGVGKMLACRAPHFQSRKSRQRLVESGTALTIEPGVLDQICQPADNGHASKAPGTVVNTTQWNVLFHLLRS